MILQAASSHVQSFMDVTGSPMLNTIVLAIAGYYLKGTADTVRSMQKEMEAHRLAIAKEYATREDLAGTIERHEELLHQKEGLSGSGAKKITDLLEAVTNHAKNK